MVRCRMIISVVICLYIFTAVVHADMVLMSKQDTVNRQSPPVRDRDIVDFNSFNFHSLAELDLWSVGFFYQANADDGQAAEMKHLQSFTNEPGRLNLYLSVMISLGLWGSAHLVKTFSFSFVPEWYHNGGPFQIGHSHAIMPESLPILVYCFTQPVCMADNSFTQYRLGTVVSLWRKSQFTPAVIASRGPPIMS